MKEWRRTVVSPTATLQEAISCIDAAGVQLAMVVDTDERLLGTVSDGDVRRAILRGTQLDIPVASIMNTEPLVAGAAVSPGQLLGLMRRKSIHHVPVVDEGGRATGLVTLDELVGLSDRSNWVVLMAGGLGTRLRPLTDNCPKPMLPVNGKPILEGIIESFAGQGFRRFYLSVNYLADQVRDHFKDGGAHGVHVEYLEEKKRLGTAGALSLLGKVPTEPLIVMNADLLTRVRFDQLLQFHQDNGAMATMAVREYDFQIPYGVVKVDGMKVTSIDEKPVQRIFVNAGIYVLSPEALAHIPSDSFFDMPTLFERLNAMGMLTVAYPVRESWMDIGQLDELERAQSEWPLQVRV